MVVMAVKDCFLLASYSSSEDTRRVQGLRLLSSSLSWSARQGSCTGAPRSSVLQSFNHTGLPQTKHGTEVRRTFTTLGRIIPRRLPYRRTVSGARADFSAD